MMRTTVAVEEYKRSMLVFINPTADFSRGCALPVMARGFLVTHPIILPFANGTVPALRVRWFSPQRIFIHRFNIMSLASRCRVENRPLSPRRRTGLYMMVDMGLGEITFPEGAGASRCGRP
jgi:hypothetical protein